MIDAINHWGNKMWEKTIEKRVSGVKKEQVWKLWKDVNNWAKWNAEVETSLLQDKFERGGVIELKLKQVPAVKLILEEVQENVSFTECAQLPGAKLFRKSEVKETEEGLEIKVTISISGAACGMWVNIVGEKVAAKMLGQMDAMIEFINI
jgi:hypothetical protein